jgi:hypothetical protein
MTTTRLLGAALLVAVLAGCGKNENTGGTAAAIDGKQYLLAAEPAGARGVREVRTDGKDGDEVVLVGRVVGSSQSLAKGRCDFTVVDLGVEVCPDGCCVEKADLTTGSAHVQLVGADGKTVPAPPAGLLGVTPRSVVVVKGKASRDSQGNLNVVASALHVRK